MKSCWSACGRPHAQTEYQAGQLVVPLAEITTVFASHTIACWLWGSLTMSRFKLRAFVFIVVSFSLCKTASIACTRSQSGPSPGTGRRG